MPKPQDVNPHNFHVERVLFTSGGFSIAWGTWEGHDQRLGMRWDGNADGDAGYPKTFGHPVWFIIEDTLRVPLVKALLGCEGARNSDILSVLTDQLDAK